MRVFAAVTLAIWVAAGGAARAQTFSEKQRNAMNHLAQVMAIEHYCDDYKSDTMAAAALALMYAIDFDNKRVRAFMTDKYKGSMEGLRAAGKKVGCLVGWSLYGDGGENVPGLLSRK